MLSQFASVRTTVKILRRIGTLRRQQFRLHADNATIMHGRLCTSTRSPDKAVKHDSTSYMHKDLAENSSPERNTE